MLKAVKRENHITHYGSAISAWLSSIGLHLFVLLAGMITFAFTKHDTQIISAPPIEVQFVKAPELEKPEAKPIPKKVEEPDRPEPMPFADSQLSSPPPETKPEPVAEPEPEPVTEPEIVKPVPAPAAKKPETPKQIIDKAREEKQQNQSEFSSVLKNLIQEEPVPIDGAEESESDAEFPEAVLTRAETVLTMNEQEALRSQLAGCWNILPGARDAQDLVVRVQLTMAPDATVQSARLLESWKYNSNPFYRAAADSALRAVRNPACNPLNLPLNKYQQWKTITINFDPKDMF